MFKQIGNRDPQKVPNTNGMVTISVQVPGELINTDTNVTRKYHVVRVHEGEVTPVDAIYDETTGELTIETDKFSTYALVYSDVPVEMPETGDTTSTWSWMFILLGIGMVVLASKKR